MDMSKKFTRMFKKLADDYFGDGRVELHAWIIDNFDNDDIGTGKYLINQPETDAKGQSKIAGFETNVRDEELSIKVMKKHPDMWFVYSSANSIAKPLTMRDFKAIAEGLSSLNYCFIPDESKAERSLKKLL